MARIYFDTEFEGLFKDAGLISIGLTNEDGSRNFYAELNDTYKTENCSDFCKSVVLPLLTTSDSHFSMSLDDLRKRLYIWLYKSGENTVLICDSKRDIEQINELFPQGLPKNCSYKVLGFFERLKRKIKNRNRKLYKEYNLRDHHALDDAIINRIIFEGK